MTLGNDPKDILGVLVLIQLHNTYHRLTVGGSPQTDLIRNIYI